MASLYISRSHHSPGNKQKEKREAPLGMAFCFHDGGCGEGKESGDCGTVTFAELGSEFKLSLSSGRGSKPGDIAHCCWGCFRWERGVSRVPIPPPRAFGGGHSSSLEGTWRGQAAGTPEVEGRAKETAFLSVTSGDLVKGALQKHSVGSAPWAPQPHGQSGASPANFSASVDTVTSSSSGPWTRASYQSPVTV